MKSKEVIKLLGVTRPTLTKYVKEGILKVTTMHNGFYDYDDESVYSLLNKNIKRGVYCYCRVSTPKQKQDLINQEELVKQWCFSKGYTLQGIMSDIASGISFEKRKGFFELLDLILEKKVSKVIITYKDRLSRIGFNLFKYLFEQYGTEIEVISEVGSTKLDSEEIFEEIVSLLHCYSMKLYSKRKDKNIKELINDSL
jgi:putative resolvase